jgi:uncharacterized coiled-coil DUF342 family protein
MAAKSTKDELRELLLEMGMATKKDIPTKKDIREIVEDVFHEQITEYHNDMAMPEINNLKQEIKQLNDRNELIISAIKTLKDAIDNIKTSISRLKSEIRNLKADLADTISRKEFDKFKSQILRN